MGYANENSRRLIFDIETAPIADAAEFLEPATAPDNYKDQSKIDAYIKAKNAENLERCGLDIDLCRMVALGLQLEGDDTVSAEVAKTEADERVLLAQFWLMARDRHLVGFNCLGFDLPVLLRRSLYLGIQTPFIQVDKYKHPQVTDLMRLLDFNGAIKSRSLAFYCKRFGIPDTDPLKGADIARAVAEGRWSDVLNHVTADVQKTAALAERLGVTKSVTEGAF